MINDNEGAEMELPVSSKTIGEIVANQRTIQKTVEAINNKVDGLNEFKSRTDERLKNGTQTFAAIDSKITRANEMINKNCLDIVQITAAIPSKNVIYSMIVIGFAVLAFLISFFSLQAKYENKPVNLTTKTQQG
jgi:hypothetical protein